MIKVLGDESKRQEYDMLGSAGYHSSQQGGGRQQAGWSSQGFGGQMNPEDLFRKIFEEFSGSQKGGGARNPFEDFQEYAPLEVVIYNLHLLFLRIFFRFIWILLLMKQQKESTNRSTSN